MTEHLWWRDGVIYQIYPRSFQDSNDDGLGDLRGIIDRLDYLVELGIDAIWLSPFYPSPDKDFGYDISNHCGVDPRFGTIADFDELIQKAHSRNIKVVLDMVLNHTSDQHPWFLESKSNLENPRRNWYFWRDPRPGNRPPNNWGAMFGGPAWQYDLATMQSYLHLFVKEQPDLNWRNPAVRQAQLDVIRFWLARDVDGFRLDVFNAYFKDAQLRDNPGGFGPLSALTQKHRYDMDQPEMMPLLRELRSILDDYPERYSVGETAFATPEKAASYCGQDQLHAAFSFEFVGLGGIGGGWGPGFIRRKVEERENAFNAAGVWPTTVMGNHDVPRPASRYCRSEDDAMAKLAMALCLTLRGTPFLYYGDEIGMRDLKLRRDQIMDPPGKAFWPFYQGRDGCRSPMQWDATPQAGFTSGKPWLMAHPNFLQRNLAAQRQDPQSLYNLTRTIIDLRKKIKALTQGDLSFVSTGSPMVLGYMRKTSDQQVWVGLNFSRIKRGVSIAGIEDPYHLLYSSHQNHPPANLSRLVLAPHEVCILVNE